MNCAQAEILKNILRSKNTEEYFFSLHLYVHMEHFILDFETNDSDINFILLQRRFNERLLYEMLYINRELKPSLNTQSDSIRSKLFT
jgi:hypothetical protein